MVFSSPPFEEFAQQLLPHGFRNRALAPCELAGPLVLTLVGSLCVQGLGVWHHHFLAHSSRSDLSSATARLYC